MSLDATSWAWRQKLASSEKLVLLSMADRAGEDHTCYPSIARMAQDTGLNRKTVLAVLQRLRDAGLIRTTGRLIGYNNTVPEYQLVGVVGRENSMPKSGPYPKSGAVPKGAGSMPEIGTGPKLDHAQKRDGQHAQNRARHHAQNWDTESPIESPKESFSFCPEPQAADGPEAVVCTLPLNDGSEFGVTGAFVAELAPLYPRVDVVQALRGMKGWLIGNPARRKTRRGIKAFITNWLAREQDKPSGGVAGGSCGTVAGAEAGAGRRLPLLSKAVDFVSRHVAAGEDAAAMVELFCEHNRLDAAEYLPAVEAAVQAQMRG